MIQEFGDAGRELNDEFINMVAQVLEENTDFQNSMLKPDSSIRLSIMNAVFSYYDQCAKLHHTGGEILPTFPTEDLLQVP